jgi:hypothetical protein
MPVYCYRKRNGEVVTLTMSIGEMIERQAAAMGESEDIIELEDGSFARRDYKAEHANAPPPGNWPMECDASGVHPDQRREAEEHSRKIGVPTEFTEDGAAVYRSPAHRKAYLEKIGMFDRNAGYSDPVPEHR